MIIKALLNLLPPEFKENNFIFHFSTGIVIVALIPHTYIYLGFIYIGFCKELVPCAHIKQNIIFGITLKMLVNIINKLLLLMLIRIYVNT